jgi:hypothetical protein
MRLLILKCHRKGPHHAIIITKSISRGQSRNKREEMKVVVDLDFETHAILQEVVVVA